LSRDQTALKEPGSATGGVSSFFDVFRPSKQGRDYPLWLFIPCAAVLLFLVIPPLVFIIYASFLPGEYADSPGLTLQNFFDIFESLSDFETLVWNSIVFSLGSAVWALVFGTVMAWLAERSNAPFRMVAYVAAFVSFAVPGLIKVIGWILLLGPESISVHG
jgi:iron(III) transport system permease protein